ncbi:hypothetical protein ISREJYDI_CDS0124 [Pseudomonas phage UNO-G1W1]|uniref:Uncharacterized protein n=1 Tax=Pseudomonas phage UNO-G1W1 TaxID=3136609 RepID=A0AAX4QN20_9CAUD
MKVKMRQRPLANFGVANCGCCSRLSWKVHKLDKQVLKEALEDVDVEFSVADSTPGCDPV